VNRRSRKQLSLVKVRRLSECLLKRADENPGKGEQGEHERRSNDERERDVKHHAEHSSKEGKWDVEEEDSELPCRK
jgi:hypothetical protein